jgi:hypothetical protein
MRELADYIEAGHKRVLMWEYTSGGFLFDVSDEKECGTASCIAGWFCRKNFDDFRKSGLDADVYAAKKLGLTCNQSESLFRPVGFECNHGRKNVMKKACAVLRGETKLDYYWLVR